jgi:hypothetical protein
MKTLGLLILVLLWTPLSLQAEDLGNLSANPFDQDSTSNQFGRYGSPFSPDSLNNQSGAGNPFRPDSPNNPYGKGWSIEGR